MVGAYIILSIYTFLILVISIIKISFSSLFYHNWWIKMINKDEYGELE